MPFPETPALDQGINFGTFGLLWRVLGHPLRMFEQRMSTRIRTPAQDPQGGSCTYVSPCSRVLLLGA